MTDLRSELGRTNRAFFVGAAEHLVGPLVLPRDPVSIGIPVPDAEFGRFGSQPQPLLGRRDGLPSQHLTGDVAEITDNTKSTFRKRDTVDAPFVKLDSSAISSLLGPFGDNVRFAGFERMTESSDDLIGVTFRPQDLHYFVKLPFDQVWDIFEGLTRGWIHLAHAEVAIHQVNAEGSLVEKGGKLFGALA